MNLSSAASLGTHLTSADVTRFLGRSPLLFAQDTSTHAAELRAAIRGSSFLVLGGAGSVGHAVTKQLLSWSPAVLHVVDIGENALVELVRDVRSAPDPFVGEFRTLPLDIGSAEFDAFLETSTYEYVLNLAAMKHVRNEKDPHSLMRMIRVNALDALNALTRTHRNGARKYFAVSTDKAANPASLMGATKRVMEKLLVRASTEMEVSLARFANVAFSNGSLLDGFLQRIAKRQPLSAPHDVRRYFMTAEESALLCVMSCVLGDNREVFLPKTRALGPARSFSDQAITLLDLLGYEAVPCASEDEARRRVEDLLPEKKWPCYFFKTDTTGEKPLEEFSTETEQVDSHRFVDIGVIRNDGPSDEAALLRFEEAARSLIEIGRWTKADLIALLADAVPELNHLETFKYLDDRM